MNNPIWVFIGKELKKPKMKEVEIKYIYEIVIESDTSKT